MGGAVAEALGAIFNEMSEEKRRYTELDIHDVSPSNGSLD
jgi:hypothetical protein